MNLFDQISNFASSAFDSIGNLFGGGSDDYGFQGGRIDEDYAGYSGSSFMDPSQDYVGPDDELSPYYGSIPATLGNIEAYDRSDPNYYAYANNQYYGQSDVEFEDDRSYAQMLRDFAYGNLRDAGMPEGVIEAIRGFMQGTQRGGGKQAQAQGRGRVGPSLPREARPETTPAGRTSGAGRTLSGQQSIERTIEQSRRATSAARAIANQMARAGTYATNNDIADLISGSDKPRGPTQKLPGTNVRLLNLPRA